MSWVPLLLALWVLVDLLVVVGIVAMRRRAARRAARPALVPRRLSSGGGYRARSPQASGRPTSRLVH